MLSWTAGECVYAKTSASLKQVKEVKSVIYYFRINSVPRCWLETSQTLHLNSEVTRKHIKKLKMKNLIILVALYLVLFKSGDCWRRRRRRRSCVPVNCQVSNWETWSSCSQPCGTGGRQTRTRHVTSGQNSCGSCPQHLTEARDCNTETWRCQNGGTIQVGGCLCAQLYYGRCCENYPNSKL